MNHRIKVQKDGKAFFTFQDILPEEGKLDLLIVGKVPAPTSVRLGHYFQGRQGKAMWNKLTEYGILKLRTDYHDDSLISNNIGITDIVKEPREAGNEPSIFEYQEGKERILRIIDKYNPKVIFFVYKPVLENCVPFMSKIEYGFNDHLSKYFYGSKVFLYPMSGVRMVTTNVIESKMQELKIVLEK